MGYTVVKHKHPDPSNASTPVTSHSAPLLRRIAEGNSLRKCVCLQVALPLSIELKASGLGSRTYEDLDELHSRYIEPLGERIVEVTSHRWVKELEETVAVRPKFRGIAWVEGAGHGGRLTRVQGLEDGHSRIIL